MDNAGTTGALSGSTVTFNQATASVRDAHTSTGNGSGSVTSATKTTAATSSTVSSTTATASTTVTSHTATSSTTAATTSSKSLATTIGPRSLGAVLIVSLAFWFAVTV
jgi:hypothetical protein